MKDKISKVQAKVLLDAYKNNNQINEANGRTINRLIRMGLVDGPSASFIGTRYDVRTLTARGIEAAKSLTETLDSKQ